MDVTQNGVYSQNGAIGQNGVYHHKRVGSQNGVNAENTVIDQTWAICQTGVHSHQGVVSDNAVSCQNWDLANSLNGTEGQNENQDGAGSQYGVYSINGTGSSHGEEEEEQNYVTMKTDLSILPISDV